MNKTIIKLALDAHLLNYVEHETPRSYFVSADADVEDVTQFAYLIIQKCLNVVEQSEGDVEYSVFKIREMFDPQQ